MKIMAMPLPKIYKKLSAVNDLKVSAPELFDLHEVLLRPLSKYEHYKMGRIGNIEDDFVPGHIRVEHDMDLIPPSYLDGLPGPVEDNVRAFYRDRTMLGSSAYPTGSPQIFIILGDVEPRNQSYSSDQDFVLALDPGKDELWVIFERSPEFFDFLKEKFGKNEDGLTAPFHGIIGSREVSLARLHTMAPSSQTGQALMKEILLQPNISRELRFSEVFLCPDFATLPAYRHRNGSLVGLGASEAEGYVPTAKL